MWPLETWCKYQLEFGISAPRAAAPMQLLCPRNVPQLCQRKTESICLHGFVFPELLRCQHCRVRASQSHKSNGTVPLKRRWIERRLFPPPFPCSGSPVSPAKKRFCRVCISQFIFTSFASLVSFGSPASLEALGAGEEQH